MKRIVVSIVLLTTAASYFVALPLETKGKRNATEAAIPAIRVETFTLENGLTFLHARVASRLVAIYAGVNTGSATEGKYVSSGISHFVEHMLFDGSKGLAPDEFSRTVRSVGGYTNAHTGKDTTAYEAIIPREHFEKIFRMFPALLFHPTFPGKEFEKEKKVIMREMDMGKDSVGRRLSEALWRLAFRVHPYRYPVIGIKKRFSALQREDLVNYHRTTYTTENTAVAVVGDVDIDTVKKMAEKYFADLPHAPLPTTFPPPEPPQTSPRRLEKEDDVTMTRLAMAYHIPSVYSEDMYPLDVAAVILGKGTSSRLYRRLKMERPLVHSVSAWSYTPRWPGLFGITAAMDDANMDKVQRIIREEIENLRSGEITAAEVKKAKRMVVADYVANLQGVENIAQTILSDFLITGDAEFSRRYVERIEKVDKADIRRVARKYLKDENLSVVILRPRGKAARHAPPPRHRVTMPSLLRLRNGMTVLLIPRRNIPMVVVRCLWKGGVLAEDSREAGISSLWASTLERAVARDSALLEERGGSFSAYAGYNSIGCSVEVLKDDLELALNRMAQVIARPRFSKNVLESARATQLASLKAVKESPFATAMKTFRRAFFGKHPYGRLLAGNEETVRRMDLQRLISYHYTTCRPSKAVLVICGDIRVSPTIRLVRKYLGNIETQGGGTTGQYPPTPTPAPQEVIETGKYRQAIVVVGYPGTAVLARERYVFETIAEMLSGQDGILWNTLREKGGMVYTAGAYNMIGLQRGALVLYAATAPQLAETVKKRMMEVMKTLDDAVTAKKLEEAKHLLVGERLREEEYLDALSMNMGLMQLYGAGYKEAEAYPARVKAVSMKDVRAVIEKLKAVEPVVVVVKPAEGER